MNTDIILLSGFAILAIFNLLIFVYNYTSNKDIKKKIQTSVEPKFLEIAISPNSNKIITLGVDIWRLEDKCKNLKGIDENSNEKINISIKRVNRFFEENKILIKWYVWEKYSEEINVYELKWVEPTDKKEMDNIIKDTIEPAVFIDWNIIKKAKIIVYKLNS